MKTSFVSCGLAALTLGIGILPAKAATTILWDGTGVSGGTGSTFWNDNTSGNWNAGTGSNANFNNTATSLDFGSIPSAATSTVVTLGSNATSAETINLSNLYFQTAGTAGSGTVIAPSITLNGTNGGVAQATNLETLALSGSIYIATPSATSASAVPVATLGADINLVLSNSAHTVGAFASTTGGTLPTSPSTITGGTVLVNKALTTGTTTSTLTLGGTVAFNGNQVKTTVLMMNDNNTFSAPVVVVGNVMYTSISSSATSASAMGVGGSTLLVSNSAYFGYIGTGNNVVTRQINLGSSAGLLNESASATTMEFTNLGFYASNSTGWRLDSSAAGSVLKLSGVITDNGSLAHNLTIGAYGYFNAAGAWVPSAGLGSVALTQANTFTGGVTLNADTLVLGNAAAIGTGRLTLNGGKIDNGTGASMSLANNNVQTWGGSFTFVGTNDLNLGTGNVTLAANTLTVTPANGLLTVGGIISGGSTGKTLTIGAGNGTLLLSGANTFVTPVIVAAGNETLAVGDASALGTGTLTMNGGKLDNLKGTSLTLSTNNAQTWAAGFTFTGTNSLNMGTGAVSLTNSAAVNVAANTFQVGTITQSAAGKTLTKTGSGTLVFNGGTISTVAVNAGTLGSTGTLNAIVTVASGAILLAGDGASTGTLTVAGNVTLSSGSALAFYLGDGTTSSTLARSSGTWTFAANQQIELFNIQAGTYTLITGLAADPGSEINWTLLGGSGYQATFSYVGNSIVANITAVAVPEPSTWMLMLGGSALLLAAARRLAPARA